MHIYCLNTRDISSFPLSSPPQDLPSLQSHCPTSRLVFNILNVILIAISTMCQVVITIVALRLIGIEPLESDRQWLLNSALSKYPDGTFSAERIELWVVFNYFPTLLFLHMIRGKLLVKRAQDEIASKKWILPGALNSVQKARAFIGDLREKAMKTTVCLSLPISQHVHLWNGYITGARKQQDSRVRTYNFKTGS